MAVRTIRILGEPGDDVLRKVASPVDVLDGSVQTLIDDMLETMRDAPGIGLAAPQVGVGLRIVVIEVPEVPAFALINGEIVHHSGQRWVREGCLSIPGYRGELFRSVKVTVKGLDRQGRQIRIKAADDLLAQALEHEIDHTNGLLYVDLLSGPEHLHRHSDDENDETAEVEPGEESNEACERVADATPTHHVRRGIRPRLVMPPAKLRATSGGALE